MCRKGRDYSLVPDLSDTRRRDLRSLPSPSTASSRASRSRDPARLRLNALTLDGMVPRRQVSHKRWANLRSDLAAALEHRAATGAQDR